MASPCYIGVDTSNYTTSLAIVREDGTVVANLKMPLPVKPGERGLRQSDAVFHHTNHLPSLATEAEAILRDYTPVAVGVSVRPRDVEDSYMPCFLAGKSAAYAMASVLHLPVYEVSHQNGHILAAAYSAGCVDELLSRPFGAFHVSGGTTEVLYVTPKENDVEITLVGETADINAGQLIDRVGVAMGLKFPCGPEMERYARENTTKIPKPKIHVKGTVCNLSGIENIAVRMYEETADRAFVSAFVLNAVAQTLVQMTEGLLTQYPELPVLYAGGVMSNRILQAELGSRFHAFFSEPAFSADNAAGVALLCRLKHIS